jgi:hypothetical protein
MSPPVFLHVQLWSFCNWGKPEYQLGIPASQVLQGLLQLLGVLDYCFFLHMLYDSELLLRFFICS